MSLSNVSYADGRAFSAQAIYLQAGQVTCVLVVEDLSKCFMHHVPPAEAALLEAFIGQINLGDGDIGEHVRVLPAFCDPGVLQVREYLMRASSRK